MKRRVAGVLSFLLLYSLASSQNAGKIKLSYKLLSIRVKGLSHFTPDQVIAASGLKIGQAALEADFKTSIERLGNTGLFTDLTYSYEYSPAGCNLEFQVSENDKLAPIIFDNFVWFTDDELLGTLRERLPLFDGSLPLAGGLADDVARILDTVLAGRKIAGKAEYLRPAKEGAAADSYVYKVSGRSIVIRNVDFPGASSSETAELQAAARPLAGQNYLRTKMNRQEKSALLPAYRSRGYLMASFSGPQATVAEDGAQTLVDVSFPVFPGPQYKVAAIQWTGNTVFPSGTLLPLIKAKQGEPANSVALDADLDGVQKLYATRGYLSARVTPLAETDDSKSTVRYELKVTEGDQFRMGQLVIDGLDAGSSSKVAAQWQMKTGDPFDDSYTTRFFNTMYRDIGLRGSWSVVHRQSVNQHDKTVSVTLHFMPKA